MRRSGVSEGVDRLILGGRRARSTQASNQYSCSTSTPGNWGNAAAPANRVTTRRFLWFVAHSGDIATWITSR